MIEQFTTSMDPEPHAKDQLYNSIHSWSEANSLFYITLGTPIQCQTTPVTLHLQKLMWQLFAMKINLWLPKSFESTLTIENGLPDFHKLIVTALKVKHEKVSLKLYSSKTTKSLTRKDFLINFQYGFITSIWLV